MGCPPGIPIHQISDTPCSLHPCAHYYAVYWYCRPTVVLEHRTPHHCGSLHAEAQPLVPPYSLGWGPALASTRCSVGHDPWPSGDETLEITTYAYGSTLQHVVQYTVRYTVMLQQQPTRLRCTTHVLVVTPLVLHPTPHRISRGPRGLDPGSSDPEVLRSHDVPRCSTSLSLMLCEHEDKVRPRYAVVSEALAVPVSL